MWPHTGRRTIEFQDQTHIKNIKNREQKHHLLPKTDDYEAKQGSQQVEIHFSNFRIQIKKISENQALFLILIHILLLIYYSLCALHHKFLNLNENKNNIIQNIDYQRDFIFFRH